MSAEVLCFLHEDDEPEHWVPEAETVGVVAFEDGQVRPDLGMVPAALECVEAAGIEPVRVADWDPARARWAVAS